MNYSKYLKHILIIVLIQHTINAVEPCACSTTGDNTFDGMTPFDDELVVSPNNDEGLPEKILRIGKLLLYPKLFSISKGYSAKELAFTDKII